LRLNCAAVGTRWCWFTQVPTRRRLPMPDLIYSLLIVGFFVLAWSFTKACEKL
jgi:hypothetical protein